LPSFSEAWRAKGLAEVRKAEVLSSLGKPDAERYYRDAIKSFSRVTGDTSDDITLRMSLAKAFFETGDGKKALNILSSIQATHESDPEISALMQNISSRMNIQGGAG
ncbi:MAG: tetratricopeptide repeat protein, partial [Methanobacteriota archaeon]